ncbi:MAG: tetratricopeptide repeat protein [Myxococcota bacterium]|nr:tetratricopeptide repeat protein [Myxococcota bacterium]
MADLDRNELEQRALRELSRNQFDRATRTYTQILRLDPRDRRIRQKLAEVLLKDGRERDAEKQYRQLVKVYRHDGNHRALVAVLLQVKRLAPDDSEVTGRLGEAYRNLGRLKEARPLLEKAWRTLQRQDIETALSFADMRLAMDPSDIPFIQEIAEGLVAQNMIKRAYSYYERGMRFYRQRGQMEEMGRLAVRALELKPGDSELLQAAAEASLAIDDVQTALQHLQPAFAENPSDPVVLDLMARCFEHVGDHPKALRVLTALAAVHEQQDDPRAWVATLERAQRAGGDVGQALGRAQQALERAELRLYDLESAKPADNEVGRPCVQAEVFVRYGFVDRAASVLDQARTEHPQDLALLAWRAEVALLEGDDKTAQRLGMRFFEGCPQEDRERAEICLHRLGIAAPVAQAEPDLDDEDELIDDEDTEPPMAAAPAQAVQKRTERAYAPPPPSQDELDPFGDAGGLSDPFGDPGDPFAGVGDGTLAEIDPDDMDPFAGLDDLDDDEPAVDPQAQMDEARGLMGMGEFADARQALEGVSGLEAAALRARCQRELGDLSGALGELRDELDEADESEPGWMEATFELADLAGRAGKAKLALRSLKQIHDLDRTWRAKDVAARVRVLRKKLGR